MTIRYDLRGLAHTGLRKEGNPMAEISEAMQAAGWRYMPDEATRKAWEEKGGEWYGIYENAHGFTRPLPVSTMGVHSGLRYALPVHPSTWDYAPEGWPDIDPVDELCGTIGYLSSQLPDNEGGTCAALWLEKLTGVPAEEILAFVNVREKQRNGEDLTPTARGAFWWRPSTDHDWLPVMVFVDGVSDRLMVAMPAMYSDTTTLLDRIGGEWGGAIPMPSP